MARTGVHRAVFLDRDNTLTVDPGYITDPRLIQLLPGVAKGLCDLKAAGFQLVVATNQSGIARGLLTEPRLHEIHEELRRQLRQEGVELDAIYYCPYYEGGTVPEYSRASDDRKPGPGMILRAAKERQIDLAESWMVGDKARDVEAGRRAGCRTIRICESAAQEEAPRPDHFAADFQTATSIILSNSKAI